MFDMAGLAPRLPAALLLRRTRPALAWASGENMLGDRFRADRLDAAPSPPWLLRAGDMKGENDMSPSAAYALCML